jgi:hypothetical protein
MPIAIKLRKVVELLLTLISNSEIPIVIFYYLLLLVLSISYPFHFLTIHNNIYNYCSYLHSNSSFILVEDISGILSKYMTHHNILSKNLDSLYMDFLTEARNLFKNSFLLNSISLRSCFFASSKFLIAFFFNQSLFNPFFKIIVAKLL